MKKVHNYITAITTILLSIVLLGILPTTQVYADGGLSDIFYYSYGSDGYIDGSKDFVIPANAGDNFNIVITFTGIEGINGTLSFAYDRVTDDQMVANVQNGADDRSGLLNEVTKYGVEETRSFSVAAIDGDITITATGTGHVTSITATPQAKKTADDKVTIYTIGDSLVQTYSARYAPQTGWGQTLSLYFNDNVNFVNRALGGRSTGNYMRQGRLNQVLCEIKPGDIVLIEFGHNDATTNNADRFVSPRDFRYNLEDVYLKCIRDRGGIPILVTLCNRNQYNPKGEFTESFNDYVKAMIKTAEATNTLLIDLNAWTIEHFTELSKELGTGVTSDIIYNHGIAGAYEGDYSNGIVDNTHLQYYGAKVVSGFIAESLSIMELPGISENYVPITVTEVPATPTGIKEKQYEGFLSRFTWNECENADYYKILVAEVIETTVKGASSPVHALAGDFTVAGYSTVCDYAYSKAEEGKHYAYKITAINAAGESEESSVFSFGLLTETGESKVSSEGSTNEQVTSVLDSPTSMVKIAFIAMIPFAFGIICGSIALLVKSRKKK